MLCKNISPFFWCVLSRRLQWLCLPAITLKFYSPVSPSQVISVLAFPQQPFPSLQKIKMLAWSSAGLQAEQLCYDLNNGSHSGSFLSTLQYSDIFLRLRKNEEKIWSRKYVFVVEWFLCPPKVEGRRDTVTGVNSTDLLSYLYAVGINHWT